MRKCFSDYCNQSCHRSVLLNFYTQMKSTDEEIEKAAKEYAEQYMDSQVGKEHIALACADFAKWARDQQPKLKPLVWDWQNRIDGIVWVAPVGNFGSYTIWLPDTSDSPEIRLNGIRVSYCDNFEHGVQLAQADYERRINELYL